MVLGNASALSIALLEKGNAYAVKVLDTSPIALFKLDDSSAVQVTDSSGNAYHGPGYTSVTLEATAPPMGGLCPLWDGSNDYADIYTAGLAGAFDFDEGCLLIWVKVSAVGVWTDGTSGSLIHFKRDADNELRVEKSSTNNSVLLRIESGTTVRAYTHGSMTTTGWFSIMVSWSLAADLVRYFVDGVQVSTLDTLGTATGSGLSSIQTLLGAFNQTPTSVFDGYIAYASFWDKPADAAMIALGTV